MHKPDRKGVSKPRQRESGARRRANAAHQRPKTVDYDSIPVSPLALIWRSILLLCRPAGPSPRRSLAMSLPTLPETRLPRDRTGPAHMALTLADVHRIAHLARIGID